MRIGIGVLIAGGTILGGAFSQSYPDLIAHPPQSANEACGQFLDPGQCRAAASVYHLEKYGRLPRRIEVPALPDRDRTPGAIDPGITEENIGTTICAGEGETKNSPPLSWQIAATRRLVEGQYPRENPDDFALDHLVPISLGGAASDPRNLWLQTWLGPERDLKDRLENLLLRMVCSRQLPLSAAQRVIASDWRDTYQRAMTPRNLERYHLPSEWAELPPLLQRDKPQEEAQITAGDAAATDAPLVLQAELIGAPSYEVPGIPLESSMR